VLLNQTRERRNNEKFFMNESFLLRQFIIRRALSSVQFIRRGGGSSSNCEPMILFVLIFAPPNPTSSIQPFPFSPSFTSHPSSFLNTKAFGSQLQPLRYLIFTCKSSIPLPASFISTVTLQTVNQRDQNSSNQRTHPLLSPIRKQPYSSPNHLILTLSLI